MPRVLAPQQKDAGRRQPPILGGGCPQTSVPYPPGPCSYLILSCSPRQKPYRTTLSSPASKRRHQSFRPHLSQDGVISEAETLEEPLLPSTESSAQGARCLQPALAALLAPLCRALPVPLGQHQQWAGPNKSRLSRHRRQVDPLRCTVGMR